MMISAGQGPNESKAKRMNITSTLNVSMLMLYLFLNQLDQFGSIAASSCSNSSNSSDELTVALASKLSNYQLMVLRKKLSIQPSWFDSFTH